MKRIMSVLLSVVIAVSVFCTVSPEAFSEAVGGQCGNNLNWSFDPASGVLTLSGTGRMYDYEDEANPAPWMNSYKTQIKSVVCKSGVTSVGSKAFMNCTSLTSVDFGDTMDIIGYYAFRGCTSLGGVAIPDSVTQTWPGCFENCTSIGWLNFGTGLTEIAGWSFAGCNSSSFWWVSLPENITVIGEHAFDGCSNLGWNTVAGKNITFGEQCFQNIKSDATFIIADKATREYLQNYNSGWNYRCVDDKHSLRFSTTDPTCTEKGYTTYTCEICENSFNEDFVDALGHNYQNLTVSSDDYYYNYICQRCGEIESVSAIDLKRHFKPYLNSSKEDSGYNRLADVNNDGVINVRDFTRIKFHLEEFDEQSHATSVNTSSTHQTLIGFGASACWWAQCVGGWDDAKINEIMTLLYDKKDGIGLNIYRYNLGAGSENDEALYIRARRAECFLKPDGTYDWNADANARKCLEYAKNIYGDDLRVTLFSNSAPVQFTINGRAYGDFVPEGGAYKTNLASSNYQKHADYVVKCAEHFTNEGYRVTNISPINEPEWAWGSYNAENTSAGQEGCHFTAEECRDFYKKCISAINNSSVKDTCKIEMWESGQMGNDNFEAYLQQMLGKGGFLNENKYKNKELRNYFDTVSFHSYWADQAARERTASLFNESNYKGYKRALTEYCQMDGSSSGLGIDKGIELADTIYQDLTILDAEEWDWWVAVAEGGYMDGLIYTDYQNEQSAHEITTAKRLWVMGNYAKFTNEGSVRVDVTCNIDGVKTCAFDNQDGTVSIVYINTTLSDEITTLNPEVYTSFSTYVTDDENNLEPVQKSLSATGDILIPARSVTTVVAVKGQAFGGTDRPWDINV